MFAPFTPHITEEVWHWHFAAFSDKPSIHLAPWPDAELFASLTDAESEAAGNDVFEALALARKAKSELNISIKKQAKKLTIGFKAADAVDQKRLANIKRMQTDLLNTANADELELKAEVLAEGYELDESKLKAQLELHPAE
jgi:valyl-tRNA synthetase